MPDPFADDPSLIHHVAVDRPGTHVLAIGIGYYDHLPGGGGTPTPHHLNLPQITSPPCSARKVASWFIEKFDCPEKPLASVSLVVSEPAPVTVTNTKTNTSYTVPTGTMQDVRNALKAWVGRARDPSSRIILYFSGHGLSKGLDNLYLLRDYGRDPADPLLGALNYQKFVAGLATREPSQQFLLFDACRWPDPIADLNRSAGEGVFMADPAVRLGIAQAMQQCPIFSTEPDSKALGRPGEESLCARAFIRVMSGACSKMVGPDWYVTTDRIVEALSDFQNRELTNAAELIRQSADALRHAKIPLRKLVGPPSIPVFVCLNDASLAPNVRIKAVRGALPPKFISDPGQPGWKAQPEWETELEIGEYLFEAEPLQGGGASLTNRQTVYPILTEVKL